MRQRAAIWGNILEEYEAYRQSIAGNESPETQEQARKVLQHLLHEMLERLEDEAKTARAKAACQ